MLLAGGGILIDTPGMRELQLWDTGEALGGAFADVEALAAACRFRDCRHLPGAGLRRARRGQRAASCAAGRLESYHKLQAEQEHQARQLDARALLEEKRRAKIDDQGAATST